MTVDATTGEETPTLDTEEMKRRAYEDAVKDIKDADNNEGEDDRQRSYRDQLIRDIRIQFVASFQVYNRDTGESEHGISKQLATSPEAALGKMYMELVEQFNCEDGWSSPSILMDDQPVLLIPGLGLPIGVDLHALLDSGESLDKSQLAV